MLRFVDSFDLYSITTQLQKWNVVSSTTSAFIVSGRNGSGWRSTHSSANITKTLTSQSTWIVGFAFRTNSYVPGAIFQFLDAGTAQCALMLGAGGFLSVVRGAATAITGATSITPINTNIWYYIEMKVAIADSIAANSCIVKLNGVEIINVPAGQDLKAGTNTTANQIYLRTAAADNNDYDDMYVCDGTGSINNDFLGDSKPVTSLPTANGSIIQFTPSAGSNYQNVDDATPDADTTYNQSTTIGHIDLYPVPPLAATPTNIFGLQVSFSARKTDAASANVRAVLRIGGTNYFGPTRALSDDYLYYTNIWETNPATSTAWTRATYEACEIGYQYVS